MYILNVYLNFHSYCYLQRHFLIVFKIKRAVGLKTLKIIARSIKEIPNIFGIYLMTSFNKTNEYSGILRITKSSLPICTCQND